jgi:hypothetical protein
VHAKLNTLFPSEISIMLFAFIRFPEHPAGMGFPQGAWVADSFKGRGKKTKQRHN